MDSNVTKNVLYIALELYAQEITSKMKQLGYSVDYFNEKPNNGFWCKALVRFNVKAYEPVLNRYYKNLFNSIKDNHYDYIVFMRGEFLTETSIQYCKNVFPDSKFILYMWDSLENYPKVKKLWKYFDKVLTFDRKDFIHYQQEGVSFRPLFYLDQYKHDKNPRNDFKYDIAFIGTGHEDRPRILKSVAHKCSINGKKIFLYIYLPHKMVYFYNKIFIKSYRKIYIQDIHFKKLSTIDCVDIYSSSKCIIDIESATQTGLTMRTIEMLGLHKKLITTNKDIVNYDFYNKDNIYIIDRKNVTLNFDFLDIPFTPVPKEIMEKYSLEGWVKEVLS